MKKKSALISLFSLGLLGTLLGVASAKVTNVKAKEETPTIHVMSCNLAQDVGNNETLKAIGVGIMKREDPDIIGVQEQAPGWTATLASELDEYTQYYTYRGGSIAPYEASGIYFKTERFHLKGQGTFWFGNSGTEYTDGHIASEWGACFARVCSYVLLNDLETGKDIGFFNAHLEYNHPYGQMSGTPTATDNTVECRLNSVDQMIRHINDLGVPCFLTGDFNFWREIDTDAFDHLEAVMTDSYEYMKTRGGDTGYTFHGNCGHDNKVEINYPHTPIDYNLCTKGDFIPTTFKIYKEGLEYEVTPREECYSDHFYISTVYEYACEYPGSGEQYIDNYILEAEHGEVIGTSSEQHGEPMIGTRSTSNERPTSNGTCIMNFATAGNSITWKFSTSKAVNDVQIGVYYAPSSVEQYDLNDSYSFTLNGKTISWETKSTPSMPGDYAHWYNWEKLLLNPVDIPKGGVTLTLTNKLGRYGNFDNIEIPFNTSLLITDWVDPTVYEDLTIEAEAQLPDDGTPQVGSSGWLVFNNSCSRGACIGNWDHSDTYTEYHISASKAFTGKITIFASNFLNNTDPNDTGGIYVKFNGTQVYFDEKSWSSITEGYYVFQELHLSNLSFVNGDNIFRIENGGLAHNVDKYIVSYPSDATVSYEDELENFCKDDLHMEDYTESKGWCKDTTHAYYANAKISYLALSDSDKEIFYTVDDFSDAYERFQAWARANNDVLEGTTLSSIDSLAQVLNIGSSPIILIILLSTAAASLIILVAKKAKKRYK